MCAHGENLDHKLFSKKNVISSDILINLQKHFLVEHHLEHEHFKFLWFIKDLRCYFLRPIFQNAYP